MDSHLHTLIQAVNTAVAAIKPQNSPLSFMLMLGKKQQGKSALLRQTHMKTIQLDEDSHLAVYYNAEGIVVEINETWLLESHSLLKDTLKQLNRCHPALEISGIGLCVDLSEFIAKDATNILEIATSHAKYLTRFANALPSPVDLAIFFTKTDSLAGFTEFFQQEHTTELEKPLGFSVPNIHDKKKLSTLFNLKFDQLIEMLSQKIIQKMHSARSGIKRTLVKEFPLQLASLRPHIQVLLQQLPKNNLSLQALYFTSAEQGGASIDHINKRIGHEYALVVQDRFIQANNFKSYFIENALVAFQQQTKRAIPQAHRLQRYAFASIAVLTGFSLAFIIHHHVHTSALLDMASKQLLEYEHLMKNELDRPAALVHLSQAKQTLNQAVSKHSNPNIIRLAQQLEDNTAKNLEENFLPKVLGLMEQKLLANQTSPADRFETLKVYLMLADKTHYQKNDIILWFKNNWKNNPNELALIEQVLNQPIDEAKLNHQLVTDVQNYLNAMPSGFLFYSLAKKQFSPHTQPLTIPGFNLAHQNLPIFYTKDGYQNIVQKIPQITQRIQESAWVLNKPISDDLNALLIEAYAYDYVTWWQAFVKKSQPSHFTSLHAGRIEINKLAEHHSISQLLELIQAQTSPVLKDAPKQFNELIASQFTDLNLISKTIENELNLDISELNRFLATLAVVDDEGRTAFNLSKSRFLAKNAIDPLSMIYHRSQQLPEPMSSWNKQIAEDIWSLLLQDTTRFINKKWQEKIYENFSTQISNRYPFDNQQSEEISLVEFNQFFGPHGTLNEFVTEYIKPFLDTQNAEWQSKAVNGLVLPISQETINELIRANVITNMFFIDNASHAQIQFSLQKLNLDPIVSHLELQLGQSNLTDTQRSESITEFKWPEEGIRLSINSIEGNHFEMVEKGPWAMFRLLEKMNVTVDENDSSNLEVMLDLSGYTGRYLLHVQGPINPFIPGILNGFGLPKTIIG